MTALKWKGRRVGSWSALTETLLDMGRRGVALPNLDWDWRCCHAAVEPAGWERSDCCRRLWDSYLCLCLSNVARRGEDTAAAADTVHLLCENKSAYLCSAYGMFSSSF